MPIKFRCVHCRQLLGISRGKAGQPVDCPSCGRTVRVPNLDGRVDPIATPELDLQDSALAKALDQLAMIGQLPDEEVEFDEADDEAAPPPAVATTAPPVAAPKPIAPVAPLPAQIVAPKPAAAEADLADLARTGAPAPHPAAAWQSPAASRSALVATALVGLTALALGFTAGYITGRGTAPTVAPTSSAPVATNLEPSSASPAAATSKPALRGRITYRTEAGDSRPDAGARVIVLPEKRSGTVKLSEAGFRAADAAADFQVVAAMLRASGGDVAIVGEDGQYEIALPAAGNYHILVLSRFQPESGDAKPEPGLKSLLEAWFSRPEQLLGRVRHHLGLVNYKGTEPSLWDHSFERAS